MREWKYGRLAQLHSEMILHFYVLHAQRTLGCWTRQASLHVSKWQCCEGREAEWTRKYLPENQREAFLLSEARKLWFLAWRFGFLVELAHYLKRLLPKEMWQLSLKPKSIMFKPLAERRGHWVKSMGCPSEASTFLGFTSIIYKMEWLDQIMSWVVKCVESNLKYLKVKV